MRVFSTGVRTAHERGWTNAVSSVCSDCVETQLSVWRREADGTVRMFMTRWDSTTAGRADATLRELSERMIMLHTQ